MKITHLIYDFSPGGAERFVVDLCCTQLNSSDRISILCVKDIGSGNNSFYLHELSKDIYVRSIGCKGRVNLITLLRILFYLVSDDSDIIHAHTFSNLIYLPALLLRKKIVWTIHSLPSYYIQNRWTKAIDRFLFLKKKILPVTISKQCHESFVNEYGVGCDRTILNGRSETTATEMYEKVKKEICDLRNGRDIPVFIHVARYDRLKNQIMLVSAFNKLYDEGLDFVLLIIGPYTEKLKVEANISPSIHIMGQKKNVGDYLSFSDYFVLTSLHEGLPLSLLEAMSKGCIPISTPAGGIVDVISDNKNGFLSPSFDTNDFIATIKRALRCSSVSREEVLKEYSSKYTMEICAENYYSIYNDVLSESK